MALLSETKTGEQRDNAQTPASGTGSVRRVKPSLKRNALSSAAVMALGVVVTFFLTPILLNALGERRYGMWTLTSSLVGYFSLLQFGLTTSVFYYVPLFRGRNEPHRVNSVVSTSMVFYSFVGIVVLVSLLTGARAIARFFDGGPELTNLIRIIGVAFALELPSLILNTTITGYEGFIKTNVISAWALVLRAGLLFGCVWMGWGLEAMAWSLVIVRVATLLGQCHAFRQVCGDVHLSWRAARWSELKMLLLFGGVIVIASTGNALAVEAPKQIVGKLKSLEALSIFGVVVMLVSYFRQIIFTLTKVLTPRFSYFTGSGTENATRSLFLRSSRYIAMLATGVGMMMWVAGPSFLTLWTKRPEMAQGATALLVLVFGNTVLLTHRVTTDLLLGLGRQKLLATFEMTEAVAILVLTICLCMKFGITGAACGMAVPFIIMRGVVQPFFVCRLLEVRFLTYYFTCAARPWVAAGILGSLCWFLDFRHVTTTWVTLIGGCAAVALSYLLIIYFVVIDETEKKYVGQRVTWALKQVKRSLMGPVAAVS